MTQNKNSTRYYSERMEKKVAAKLDMNVVPNSGATAFQKGDVRDEYTLVECKTLTKEQKSHTVQKEWYDKNREEAFDTGRQNSALAFDFGPGTPVLVAVDLNFFADMYKAWLEKYC